MANDIIQIGCKIELEYSKSCLRQTKKLTIISISYQNYELYNYEDMKEICKENIMETN